MTYLSIIEKFKILFNSLLDFKFVLIFSILLLVLTFIYAIKKMSAKKYILLMIMSFVIVFGISIISNYKVLSNTFDDFATIFFGNIYFPSIYVYVGVLVISFIAFVVSMFNVMLKKIYKVINSIMFVVNNILFVIVLNVIAKNKIDVFSINSLYTNTSLVAILELSMGLCVIWVLSLIITYVTNVICDRMAYKKIVNTEEKEMFNPVLELEVSDDSINDVNVLTNDTIIIEQTQNINEDVLVEEIATNEEDIGIQNIDNGVEGINDNVVLEIDNTYNDTLVIETEEDIKENTGLTFNDILNGCVPVTYYENSVVNNDYELFNPQMIYENNYNKVKSENFIVNEISLNDLVFNNVTEASYEDNVSFIENVQKETKDTKEDIKLSVEELTLIEKEKASEERLVLNTVSLNDLIDEEIIVNEIESKNDDNVLEKESNNMVKEAYTIDDYKKMMEMLNSIKSHSIKSNINIDDAVAISLISNYSVDDCMKFKNLLESNLN